MRLNSIDRGASAVRDVSIRLLAKRLVQLFTCAELWISGQGACMIVSADPGELRDRPMGREEGVVTGGRIAPGHIHASGEPPERAHYTDVYTLVTDIAARPRQWLVACFEEGIPRRDRDVIFRSLAGFATLPDRTPGYVAGWELIHDDESSAELAATGPRMTGRLRLSSPHHRYALQLVARPDHLDRAQRLPPPPGPSRAAGRLPLAAGLNLR